MSFEFWGQSPITTTVSASPAPTTTVFTVASATDLVEGQYILVEVSGNDERAKISDITGNVITLDAALSDVPTTPGSVKSGRELVKNSKLNHGLVGIADSITDLATTTLTNVISFLKAHLPRYGMYMISDVTGQPADDEMIITNGSHQWEMELPNAPLIESWIQEYCSPLLTEIEILRNEVDRLNALSAYAIEYYIITERPNIGILTTGTGTELLFPVVPAILTELRETDRVSIQSFPLPAGVLVGGVSLQGGNISVRIHNPTAGSITPGVTPISFKIERASS